MSHAEAAKLEEISTDMDEIRKNIFLDSDFSISEDDDDDSSESFVVLKRGDVSDSSSIQYESASQNDIDVSIKY